MSKKKYRDLESYTHRYRKKGETNKKFRNLNILEILAKDLIHSSKKERGKYEEEKRYKIKKTPHFFLEVLQVLCPKIEKLHLCMTFPETFFPISRFRYRVQQYQWKEKDRERKNKKRDYRSCLILRADIFFFLQLYFVLYILKKDI